MLLSLRVEGAVVLVVGLNRHSLQIYTDNTAIMILQHQQANHDTYKMYVLSIQTVGLLKAFILQTFSFPTMTFFRGTHHVKKRDSPAKNGTAGRSARRSTLENFCKRDTARAMMDVK